MYKMLKSKENLLGNITNVNLDSILETNENNILKPLLRRIKGAGRNLMEEVRKVNGLLLTEAYKRETHPNCGTMQLHISIL